MKGKKARPAAKLRADVMLDRLRSNFASDQPQPSNVFLELLEKVLPALLRKLLPNFSPDKPLPPSGVGPEIPLPKTIFAQLMTAAAVRSNQGVEVWTKDDSALIVVTGKVTLDLADGLAVIRIPVWCDQIEATVEVPFAMGGANTPSGMLVATEETPRGPDAIIAVWSEALIAFAWKTLLTVVTHVSAATGKDQDGAGLIPAALTATPNGVRILTMARHSFDQVSQ